VPDGTIAMRKAYNKFGLKDFGMIPELGVSPSLVPFSDLAASNNSGSENGQVSASSSQNDAEFLSPVAIGGQTLIMNFDTGSSDM
jgi:aspergillopepsin I